MSPSRRFAVSCTVVLGAKNLFEAENTVRAHLYSNCTFDSWDTLDVKEVDAEDPEPGEDNDLPE